MDKKNIEKQFITLKGTWKSGNTFIDEHEMYHCIHPYSPTYNKYKDKLPLDCFVLLYGKVLKEIVEI